MSSEPMSQEEYRHHVSAVWKATLLLAIVTIVEVVGALIYPEGWNRMILNLFLIVMSLTKAFYIVSVFMHLKYEKYAMGATILIPTTLLFWFIIAMLWEGSSWLWLRNIFF